MYMALLLLATHEAPPVALSTLFCAHPPVVCMHIISLMIISCSAWWSLLFFAIQEAPCGVEWFYEYPSAASRFRSVPFLTRGYAKRRNGFLLGLRYANVSLAHSGVESS